MHSSHEIITGPNSQALSIKELKSLIGLECKEKFEDNILFSLLDAATSVIESYLDICLISRTIKHKYHIGIAGVKSEYKYPLSFRPILNTISLHAKSQGEKGIVEINNDDYYIEQPFNQFPIVTVRDDGYQYISADNFYTFVLVSNAGYGNIEHVPEEIKNAIAKYVDLFINGITTLHISSTGQLLNIIPIPEDIKENIKKYKLGSV